LGFITLMFGSLFLGVSLLPDRLGGTDQHNGYKNGCQTSHDTCTLPSQSLSEKIDELAAGVRL
jgi:hypothetical protein